MPQVGYVLAGFLLILLAMRKPDWAILVTAATLPMTQSLPETGIPGFNPLNILLLSMGAGLLAGRSEPGRASSWFSATLPLFLFSFVALWGWINSTFVQEVPKIPGLRFSPYYSFLTLKEIWTANLLVVFSFCAARTVAEVRRQVVLVVAGMSVEVFFSVLEGLKNSDRILGHVGQPNSLAAFLALAGATSMALYLTLRGLGRWLFLGMAAGAVFASLHTGSRGGLLALFVSLLVISLFRNRWIFLILALLGMSYRLWLPANLLERIDRAYVVNETGQISAADTAEERFELWRAARKMVLDHPLGVGLGAFPSFAAKYGSGTAIENPNKAAHNAFVGIAAELSPIGLLLFVWALGALTRVAYGCYMKGRVMGLAPVGFAALSALLSMILANQSGEFFFQSFAVGHLWMILGLASKGERLSRMAASAPGNKAPHTTAPSLQGT